MDQKEILAKARAAKSAEEVAELCKAQGHMITAEEAKTAGFDAYYIDHTAGIWPSAAAGVPFNACEIQSKGDAITDLAEDLAAESSALPVLGTLTVTNGAQ